MNFRFVLLLIIFVFASCTTPEVKNNKVYKNLIYEKIYRDLNALNYESKSITETAPDELARSNFNKKNIIFYIPCQIADCYFELKGLSEEETLCILNSYKTKYMSIGIDMIFDEDQASYQSFIENWIRSYNRELLSLLKKSKKYKCR